MHELSHRPMWDSGTRLLSSLHDLPRGQLFGRMMRASGEFDPIVVSAIQKLRSLGRYGIFALTNNFTGVCSSDATKAAEAPSQPPPGFSLEQELKFLGWEQGVAPPSLRSLFDDFCDSSVLGMRQVLSAFNWNDRVKTFFFLSSSHQNPLPLCPS